uniref:Leukocyte surface antigen CD47 n=1 Tax=Sphenodon punctatus TaxID=8508 RepID=A0A8D0HPK7_SPHPU
MWVLAAWVLLGTVTAGSAQLQFNAIKSIEINTNEKNVILPCLVNNLQLNNITFLFVKWKLRGQEFFSFDGYKPELRRAANFSSAKFVSPAELPKGIASLSLDRKEAPAGNYTCEVTESNREGITTVELIYVRSSSSSPVESILITLFMILAIIFYWSQLGVVASKFEVKYKKKVSLIVAGGIVTVAAAVGFILFLSDGFTPKTQAGLGLVIIPAVILVPTLYILLRAVFENNLPHFAIVLVVVKSLGYLIAVVGFALCVSAYTRSHGSVVIAGLAVFAFVALASLIYVIIIGSSMTDHQPPRRI